MDPHFLIKEVWVSIVQVLKRKEKGQLRLVNRWFRALLSRRPLWNQWIGLNRLRRYREQLHKLGWSEHIGTLMIPEGGWDESHAALAHSVKPRTIFFSKDRCWSDLNLDFVSSSVIAYVDIHPDNYVSGSALMDLVAKYPHLFIRFNSKKSGTRITNLLSILLRRGTGYAEELLAKYPDQRKKYLDDDNNSGTPLQRLLRNGYSEELRLQLLIGYGADVNTPHMVDKVTPLISAIIGGYFRNVEILLNAGADVNIPLPTDNRTPLMIAITMANDRMIKALLDAGAKITAEQKHSAFMNSKWQEIYQIINTIDNRINSHAD